MGEKRIVQRREQKKMQEKAGSQSINQSIPTREKESGIKKTNEYPFFFPSFIWAGSDSTVYKRESNTNRKTATGLAPNRTNNKMTNELGHLQRPPQTAFPMHLNHASHPQDGPLCTFLQGAGKPGSQRLEIRGTSLSLVPFPFSSRGGQGFRGHGPK